MMMLSALTAFLNLMIAFRIITFTNATVTKKDKFFFYTALAVVLVAISFENALVIIFVGEPIDLSEFVATLVFTGVIYAVRGNVRELFLYLVRLFNRDYKKIKK